MPSPNAPGGISKVPQYTMVINSTFIDQGLRVSSFKHDFGTPDPSDEQANGEIIVKVDWGAVSGGPPYVQTDLLAPLVADYITDKTKTQAAGLDHALAESPIHMIGHSRGASLMSRLASLLAVRGLWVDQLTMLDPHPLTYPDALVYKTSSTPFRTQRPDPPIVLSSNVTFAESYWREDGLNRQQPLDFDGQDVNGALNRQLDEEVLSQDGYTLSLFSLSPEHSDVHLWYHGTIDTGEETFADAYDGTQYVTSTMRQTWYSSADDRGRKTGFYYSRIGGGAADRPASGLHTAVVSAGNWPNIENVSIMSWHRSFTLGQVIPVEYEFQDFDSGGTITFSLDQDLNPYNLSNNASPISFNPFNYDSTGASRSSATRGLGTADYNEPGTYYVLAAISDGTRTRFAYCPETIELTRAPDPADPGDPQAPLTISSVTPSILQPLTLPQTQPITVFGTGFSDMSKLVFNDGIIDYVRTPTSWTPTQLTYNIAVGTQPTRWSVYVTDGGLSSKFLYFNVGSAPANPDLAWSTYYGASGTEVVRDMTSDSLGNIYVAGYAGSAGLATAGAYDTTLGGPTDGYVAKFAPSGRLLWATYLGGSGVDKVRGISLDSSGGIHLMGETTSSDLPMQTGGRSYGGGAADAFAAKLSPQGQLVWTTYLGGSGADRGYGGAADPAGNFFVTGDTASSNFPASNAYDVTYNGGSNDAYLAKLSPDGTLLWATFIGGSDQEFGLRIALDPSGNPFVGGDTGSADFPALNAYDTSYNRGYDAFAAKFSSAGALLWSTFLGGTGADNGAGVASDASGNLYFTGDTTSGDFPTSGAFDSIANGDRDAFLVKLSANGSMVWSTFFGGSARDEAADNAAVDSAGNIYLFGQSYSTNLPIIGGTRVRDTSGGPNIG